MKISAVPSVQNSVNQGATPVVRSMTMNTRGLEGEGEPGLPTPTAQEVPISDTNEVKPEATQPLSPQFAELARRRRALQQKERALEDREKALEGKATGSGGIDPARLKSETLRVLEEAGVTYDDLTQQLLANQEDAKVRALEAKISALEEGVDKRFLEKETQAEKQVLAEMRKEAEGLVAPKARRFELVQGN
jgi:hypothetical protein